MEDLGGLRCEMELLNDFNRKDKIVQQLKLMPKETEFNEKKLKINNLEQNLFLGIFFQIQYFKKTVNFRGVG